MRRLNTFVIISFFFFRLINVAFVTIHVSKTLNAILNFIIVIITRYKGIDNECPKCTYS